MKRLYLPALAVALSVCLLGSPGADEGWILIISMQEEGYLTTGEGPG